MIKWTVKTGTKTENVNFTYSTQSATKIIVLRFILFLFWISYSRNADLVAKYFLVTNILYLWLQLANTITEKFTTAIWVYK